MTELTARARMILDLLWHHSHRYGVDMRSFWQSVDERGIDRDDVMLIFRTLARREEILVYRSREGATRVMMFPLSYRCPDCGGIVNARRPLEEHIEPCIKRQWKLYYHGIIPRWKVG